MVDRCIGGMLNSEEGRALTFTCEVNATPTLNPGWQKMLNCERLANVSVYDRKIISD